MPQAGTTTTLYWENKDLVSIGRTAACLAVLLLGLWSWAWPATAQDLGEEWEAVTASDAAIQFSAPGLERNIERHLRAKNVDNTHTAEIAFWTGPSARHPKALLHYIRAFSGMSFRSARDPKDVIRNLPMLEERQVAFESSQNDRNSLGRIRYRRFAIDDFACVGFTQSWGEVEWGSGDKMLFGYYCADPHETLSAKAMNDVIHAIGIKRSAQ
jgi:hypothetical protein